MKDQQKQSINNFTGTNQSYKMSASLSANQDAVVITVEDVNTFESFTEVIDLGYISSQRDFTNIFQEPIDLLNYFIHHFNEIIIEEGIIKIQFNFGSFKKKTKPIVVKLNKEDISPLQLANKKIDSLKETILQKQKKLIVLQQQLEQLSCRNQQLINQLQDQRQTNNQLGLKYQQAMMDLLLLKNEYLKEIRPSQKVEFFPYNPYNHNSSNNGIFGHNNNNSNSNSVNNKQLKPQIREIILDWTKIGNISSQLKNINIMAKVVSIQDVGNKISKVVLGDQTGIVTAFMRNHRCLAAGNTIVLEKVKITVVNEKMQIQLMEGETFELTKRQIRKVKLSVNMSEQK